MVPVRELHPLFPFCVYGNRPPASRTTAICYSKGARCSYLLNGIDSAPCTLSIRCSDCIESTYLNKWRIIFGNHGHSCCIPPIKKCFEMQFSFNAALCSHNRLIQRLTEHVIRLLSCHQATVFFFPEF